MSVKHDSRPLNGPIPAIHTQKHEKFVDIEIAFDDSCVLNIGITGREISIDTKVKTIRPLKIKLKIIF
ncbi:hypothetical protein DD582_33160 [Klebsiella pneumoniae]|nr:hypothetical protein DD582_33160 [Klebsiella pneumoniae]